MKAQYYKSKPDVAFGALNSNSIIGVEFNDKRSFVVKVDNSHWIATAIDSNFGFVSKVKGTSIADLMSELNDKKNVFLFDSYKELGEWLTENL